MPQFSFVFPMFEITTTFVGPHKNESVYAVSRAEAQLAINRHNWITARTQHIRFRGSRSRFQWWCLHYRTEAHTQKNTGGVCCRNQSRCAAVCPEGNRNFSLPWARTCSAARSAAAVRIRHNAARLPSYLGVQRKREREHSYANLYNIQCTRTTIV